MQLQFFKSMCSGFCCSWCCLCAHSVQTWYHFCEAAEETLALTMSNEKPKERAETENDCINLRVAGQDGSVAQFKMKRQTPLSKPMKAYCE